MMKSSFLSLVIVVAALSSGCELLAEQTKSQLFDLRMLLVPQPGHTRVQALCAEGNDGEQDARALVDSLNASVEEDRALLEAIAKAEGRGEGPITKYEVTVDGRTMQVETVSNGRNASITGTVDGESVLSGATSEDGAKGSLSYHDLSVSWVEEDAVLRVARSEGELSAAMVLEEDRVAIVVNEITAAWNEESGVYIDGEAIQCWHGEEKCDAECSDDEVGRLTADVEGSADVAVDF